MKKKILATVMALLLSAAMLAGCGASSKDDDRSSRNRRERSYEEDDEDSDGGWFSKWNNSASTANDLDSSENNGDITDNSTSHPTDADDSFFVDDPKPDDGNIASSSGFTSPADKSAQAEGSGVPSSGSNNVTGSSTSADDYINDIKELLEFVETETFEEDDAMAMFAEMQNLLNDLHVRTPEGLALKADLQELFELMGNVMGMLYTENYDEDILNTLEDRVLEIIDSTEKHMKAFEDAAIAAGVDMDSLDELEDLF